MHHFLNVPSLKQDFAYSNQYKWLEAMDRYCYIYGNTPTHYNFYGEQISEILEAVQPRVVFGEATLFHELITLRLCKEKGIKYLHPSTSRYPTGRFSFYEYDSLIPFGGSNEKWDLFKLGCEIRQVSERKVSPDYMNKPVKLKGVFHKLRKLKNTWYNILSLYLYREKYNTPTVIQKISKEVERRKCYKKYESLAKKELPSIEPSAIMYPLQLQPESNIDVWGAGYNKQYEALKNLVKNGLKVYVKPNPKSKYEINSSLLEVISSSGSVIPLSHDVSMNDVYSKFRYFYSPTGTINIEAIFSGKVCFSPVFPISKKFSDSGVFPEVASLTSFHVEDERRFNLMRYLVESSFEGVIGDVIHTPEVLSDDNIKKLKRAFVSVLDIVS